MARAAPGQIDERSRIETALGYIPADDRTLWLRIGMAIKSALGEAGFALWDDWSRSSERYREADARKVWRSINADGGVTIGTLFFEAAKYGYVQGASSKADNVALARAPARPAPGGPPNSLLAQPCNSATVATYAAWKKLPELFLRSLDLTDLRYHERPALRIPYRDRAGAEVAVRIRRYLDKDPVQDRRFVWRRGDKPQLYGLDRLGRPEFVVLVEGESDSHTLWYHEVPALGVPGAGTWNEARDARHLEGIARVYVVVEPDRGGEAVKHWLARSAIRDRAYLVDLAPFKDPSAMHCANPTAFKVRFAAALENAVPFGHILAEDRAKRTTEAWQACQALATQPRILEDFAQAYRAAGAVGEACTAMTLYLALTSRFLSRPVSVAVKGPSSGGKSFTVESVLRFFPPEAVYCMTAVSDRALAYTEADLEHRFLVIFEAAGMLGEFASYLIRSLLSEGRLVYEVVEKTQNGFRPRRIEKQGPTGLLVTTTAVRLHPENETRLLSLQVTDTPEQTRAILRAIAESRVLVVDPGPWLALQHWLAHAEHRVVIPYASALAEQIPPVAVRLRRDFGQLLALIHAHAILHQATRERDGEGRIVATLEDYAVVSTLVLDVIAEGIDATVAPIVRETVAAVQTLLADGHQEASLRQVAHALGLDKSAAARRIAAAVQLGYLRNLEDRKGRPARLTLGEPLPESVSILPSCEVLHCCSVDRGDVHAPPPPSQDRTGAAT
jgi:hypothetical protein